MNLAVGALDSTHDARLLRHTNVHKDITDGKAAPNKAVNFGPDYGDITLMTIKDSTFPRSSWLLEAFRDNTNNEKEKYFNMVLHSASFVTERAYGMPKDR